MSQGRQLSIYIAANDMAYLYLLRKQGDDKNKKMSQSISNAIRSEVKKSAAKIGDISIDAYMALHDGRFDLLETVVSAEDDTVSIILKSKGRKLYANSVEAFKKSLKG